MGLLNKLKGLLGLHTVTSQAVVAAPAPIFKDAQGHWGKASLNYWEIQRARKLSRRAKAVKRARHLKRVHA